MLMPLIKPERESQIIIDFLKLSIDLGAEIIINGKVILEGRKDEPGESDPTQED